MRILCGDDTIKRLGMEGVFNDAAVLCVEGEGLDAERTEISLSFVSAEEIRALNNAYRSVDKHTDVLSFPLIEDFDDMSGDMRGADGEGTLMLGDVVICLEQAEKQAAEYGHSLEREMVYLFVHSLYHLLGYDHMEAEEKSAMREREERVMKAVDLERSL